LSTETHYLEEELYQLVQRDRSIFEFLQSGSLDGIWYWDLENPENERICILENRRILMKKQV